MILLRKPNDYFVEVVDPISIRDTTKAYVVGVFLKLIHSNELSEQSSIVLSYAEAINSGRFEKFQNLGDWTLWSMSFIPMHHAGFEDMVIDVGRRSYESCWRILRGKWDVYAELADEFPNIVHCANEILKMK